MTTHTLKEINDDLKGWDAAHREEAKSRQMKFALQRIAKDGCSRLHPPSTCRKPSGYPREEWCEGCIAADGLGLSVEWFVLR